MPHLDRTARIRLARNRIADTSTRLIRADAVREVVVERAELIRAVITHPGATGSCRNGELNTTVDMRNSYMGVVFVSRIGASKKQGKKRSKKKTLHIPPVSNPIFRWGHS